MRERPSTRPFRSSVAALALAMAGCFESLETNEDGPPAGDASMAGPRPDRGPPVEPGRDGEPDGNTSPTDAAPDAAVPPRDAGPDACIPGGESCNAIDDDCDERIDEGVCVTTVHGRLVWAAGPLGDGRGSGPATQATATDGHGLELRGALRFH